MENQIESISDNTNLPEITETKSKKFMRYLRNIFIILLLIALPFIWLWKDSTIYRLKETNEKTITTLKENANVMVTNDRTIGLKQLSKAYVWAIRKEMMMGNLQQVGLYANDMVKEQNFKTIMVCNEKGVIVSATDKRLEGQAYSSVGKASHLQVNNTVVEAQNDSLLNVISPIMGFNSKLGTLIISYKNSVAKF